jgi:hypothetical protein
MDHKAHPTAAEIFEAPRDIFELGFRGIDLVC